MGSVKSKVDQSRSDWPRFGEKQWPLTVDFTLVSLVTNTAH